jgi:hypothetical protein
MATFAPISNIPRTYEKVADPEDTKEKKYPLRDKDYALCRLRNGAPNTLCAQQHVVHQRIGHFPRRVFPHVCSASAKLQEPKYQGGAAV